MYRLTGSATLLGLVAFSGQISIFILAPISGFVADVKSRRGILFATQVAPGQVIQYRVPDMLDRPWAKIWEEFFEKNMDRPKEELDLGFK